MDISLSNDHFTCLKCPPEAHEGIFCRCEERNIRIAKEKREAGKSPWKKDKPLDD